MRERPAVRIAPATQAELPVLIALSRSAGSAAHWSEQRWSEIFHSQIPRRLCLVAFFEATKTRGAGAAACEAQTTAATGAIAGFLVAQCGAPDWELENIAVAGEFRRQGVASALLTRLVEAARNEGAERLLLEVRASNDAAIAMYRRAGFGLVGRRRGYYANPPEDALILGLQI